MNQNRRLGGAVICMCLSPKGVEPFSLYFLATWASPFAKSVHKLSPFIYWGLAVYMNNVYKAIIYEV